MCGIIAYLGTGEPVAVLLEGLQRMEYRGYDSAGLGVVQKDSGKLTVVKKQGKVQNLKDACAGFNNFEKNCQLGIAHTRWATHGPPSDKNAHPHFASNKKLCVVHNGIIENYQGLRTSLSSEGYRFESDTDTEVLAILIGHIMSLDSSLSLLTSVKLALGQVRGAYGIAVIHEDFPDTLIGARKGSPLIVGVSGESILLASDATAVVGITQQVIYLEDNDVVEITMKEGLAFKVWNLGEGEGSSSHSFGLNASINREKGAILIKPPMGVVRKLHELTLNLETIEKGGFDHFMLKEIVEQPKVLKDCMRGRLNLETGKVLLMGLSIVADRVKAARRIIICACGTSWHSAQVGEYLLENLARVPVEVEYASEFRYRNPVLFEDDVVIVISQSGETADTLEAIKIAKKHGCLTLGIVNVVGSSIARVTDAGIYLHVGPEIGVASTKAFTGQVLALSMFSIWLGGLRGELSEEDGCRLGKELIAIPDKIEKMLTYEFLDTVKSIAKVFRLANNFLYLGRGYNFPVALEGALKLKEISYIHAEGYPAAEMKHGPIALIDRMMPVVVIAPRNDATYEKVKSGIEEVIARRGSVIAITDADNRDLDHLCEYVLETPVITEEFSPLLTVIPLQLLSYYIAKERGCEIDQPRNLAKSVTVE